MEQINRKLKPKCPIEVAELAETLSMGQKRRKSEQKCLMDQPYGTN